MNCYQNEPNFKAASSSHTSNRCFWWAKRPNEKSLDNNRRFDKNIGESLLLKLTVGQFESLKVKAKSEKLWYRLEF